MSGWFDYGAKKRPLGQPLRAAAARGMAPSLLVASAAGAPSGAVGV